MPLLLAGDIGGTKTILRLVETTANTEAVPQIETLYQQQYPSREFPDLVPIVQQFLATAARETGTTATPEKACFAIAGPVVNDTSMLTNLDWSLDARRLEKDLEIASIALINDFAAIGYGVLGLSGEAIHPLQAGEPQSDAPVAVIGAGTGLGQCFLIPTPEGERVFSTEGGHADFAPRSPVEFELLQYLIDEYQLQHVSAERVVSGQGIFAIYQFLKARKLSDRPDNPAVSNAKDPSAAIAKAALDKSDEVCTKTMQIFAEAYGAEAGNLALKLLPYGGLYVAGGIAAKVLPLLEESDRFLQAFLDKGRMKPLMEKVPIRIVLNPQVGLLGAAICASRL
jgi:glucokinase